MHRITLRHNFELAHRLGHPDAPTKCRSIHGHSWWATVTIAAHDLDALGMVVEFGAFKRAWRGFLDDRVDHHLALREDDPVVAALRAVDPDFRILTLPFDPTTERLAEWVFGRSADILADLAPDRDVWIDGVHIQETSVNAAEYRRS